MADRFDLEAAIQDCWQVVDDIKTIYHCERLYDSEDEMMNALLGMFTLYQIKFENLWKIFEESIRGLSDVEKESYRLIKNRIKEVIAVPDIEKERSDFESFILSKYKYQKYIKMEDGVYVEEVTKNSWAAWCQCLISKNLKYKELFENFV